MRYTDILKCECGCKTFTIARDGLIECAACKHPTANHVAVNWNVDRLLARRGVKILKSSTSTLRDIRGMIPRTN